MLDTGVFKKKTLKNKEKRSKNTRIKRGFWIKYIIKNTAIVVSFIQFKIN